MSYLRATCFWLGSILVLMFIGTGLLFLAPLPFTLRYRFAGLWPRFCIYWLGVTCGLHYEINGLQNIPKEGAILVSNHQSTWETFAMQAFFPAMVWVVKRELLWLPVFGWGLYILKTIAVDRSAGKQAMQQLLEQASDRIAKGINVVIFPEGTRVPYGEIHRFRNGAFVLAEKTGAAVVPIAHNAGYFWPRKKFVKKPGIIDMKIGEPIHCQNKSIDDIREEAALWIQENIPNPREV